MSIDVLAYMLAGQARATTDPTLGLRRQTAEADLAAIDALTDFEIGLVADNGGREPNVSERDRLAHIRTTTEGLFSAVGRGVAVDLAAPERRIGRRSNPC